MDVLQYTILQKELLEIQQVPIRGQLLMSQFRGQRPQPAAHWTHSTLDPILCGPRKSYSHRGILINKRKEWGGEGGETKRKRNVSYCNLKQNTVTHWRLQYNRKYQIRSGWGNNVLRTLNTVAGLRSVILRVNVNRMWMWYVRFVLQQKNRNMAGKKREASDEGNILNDRSRKCFFITGVDKVSLSKTFL